MFVILGHPSHLQPDILVIRQGMTLTKGPRGHPLGVVRVVQRVLHKLNWSAIGILGEAQCDFTIWLPSPHSSLCYNFFHLIDGTPAGDKGFRFEGCGQVLADSR